MLMTLSPGISSEPIADQRCRRKRSKPRADTINRQESGRVLIRNCHTDRQSSEFKGTRSIGHPDR
jgi:hypothetical protein